MSFDYCSCVQDGLSTALWQQLAQRKRKKNALSVVYGGTATPDDAPPLPDESSVPGTFGRSASVMQAQREASIASSGAGRPQSASWRTRRR